MIINHDSFKIINWQYLNRSELTPAQKNLFDTQHYDDESCRVRYTPKSIHEAVSKVVQAILSPTFQLQGFMEACGSAIYACHTGFDDKLRSIYNYGREISEAVVCLRIAVRIGAIAKKIEAAPATTRTAVLAPYAIVEAKPTSRYRNVDLFFKVEEELSQELATLYLEKSERVFEGLIKHYARFIEIIESLGVYSRERLCSSIFTLVMKKDAAHKIIEIVKQLPEWKAQLQNVLFEEKANFGWLRQKGMIQTLKMEFPELAHLILEKEEAFLRLERKIVEHESAINTAIYNDLLMQAQGIWLKNQLAPAAADVKEVKQANVVEKAEQELPNQFFCPITQEILKDPVITEAGIIYERAAIELWLKDHDTDPYTRKLLVNKTLIPVIPFKTLIEDTLEARKK